MSEKTSEIDLKELFIGFFIIIYKNFMLILICGIVGALLGLGYLLLSKKTYESKMLVNSALLTISFAGEIVSGLNVQVDQKNYAALARALQITEEQARNVSRFEVKNLFEDQVKPLVEADKHDLVFTAKTTDATLFPLLEKGIIQYIENNEFVKIRIEQRKQYYRELIAKVNEEINDLEALKERMFKGDFLQGMKGNIMFDPTSIHNKILDLTKENLRQKNDLILADNFHVISGFSAISHPKIARKSIFMSVGGFIGLIIAFMIIGFRHITREVKVREQLTN
jgi:LPS O-antigen subunit length determinant protein (WzzB/FepE family)